MSAVPGTLAISYAVNVYIAVLQVLTLVSTLDAWLLWTDGYHRLDPVIVLVASLSL
jgi:hypothetical protein